MSSEVLKTELVKVGQDSLQAVRQSGHGWLLIKAACEVLGIDTQAQQRRLERTPWATGGMITAVGADGRTREMFCLRSDKVAMWLATIDTSLLANDEARAKLVMWQCEAADVLDRWVRGEQGVAEHKTPAALPPEMVDAEAADLYAMRHSQVIRTIKGPCFDCDVRSCWCGWGDNDECACHSPMGERTEPTAKIEPDELRPNVPPRMVRETPADPFKETP